jgi:phosphoglycolate phosphatase-like HAD superfamily hydrolase
MTSLVDDIAASDDGYARKPDPEAFEAVIAKQGLVRAETLAVGDRDIDILAGRAAGLRTCLFGTDQKSCGADLAVINFDELHRWLLAENA